VIVESLVRRQTRRDSSRLEELTDRERSVLEQMAIGRTNGSIAEALHLSVSAVEKNINAIFTKLDLGDEPSLHRRVGAVLAYLADAGSDSAQSAGLPGWTSPDS
jgi:DNA-binding NarL/FixJ family response regulator